MREELNEKMDLGKIPSIQQKRTIAFVNHFLLTMIQFMNSFIKQCEDKLEEFEIKMNRVEAALMLLEFKLSSVPNLDAVSDNCNSGSEVTVTQVTQVQKEESNTELDNKIIEKPILLLSSEYARFVKMVQVGVPLEAVKLKVSLEGLNPNELEEYLNK